MYNDIKAGTSKIDISPGKGIELAGYPHHPRHNTGIHDPLYATCLYLNSGHTKMMIISLDLLFISKKYVDKITSDICLSTGIDPKNIILSCTHTHSGPWFSGRLDFEALENGYGPDPGYVETLCWKITIAATKAAESGSGAKIGCGKGRCGKECGVGGNRRDPDGPYDDDVTVMSVSDDKGNVKACIVNYTLHPTFLHAENTLVSADYPGYIRKRIAEEYPQAEVLFLQGCSGDQSSRYFRRGQSFEEAQRVGDAIGAEACSVIKTIRYETSFDLAVSCVEIPISLRRFPSEKDVQKRLIEAEKTYDDLAGSGAAYIDLQNANVKLIGLEDLAGFISMLEKSRKIELYEDEKPARIIAARICNNYIVSMPGEIFVEFGKKIKKTFCNDTVIIASVSNGSLPGYVYTRESLSEGGYETDTSMLSDDMGEKMAKTAIDMLHGLEK